MSPLAGRSALGDEQGSHLIEVAVGALILSVAVTGLLATMGSGMQLMGNSRQRSSAVAVAQEKVEGIRTLPYDRVALASDDPADPSDPPVPAYNADPSHPDHNVVSEVPAGEPPRYRVGDSGVAEPLVIAADGAVSHVNEPVTVGKTTLSVYQYVTWVDDPGFSVDKDPQLAGDQDYKRVTVVTTWKPVTTAATAKSVVESTFVADSAIAAPESTPPPAGTGASPPPPAPTPGTGCPGDTTAPTGSMTVLSGAGGEQGHTNSTSTQIRLSTVDTCSQVYAQLSNDGNAFTGVATLVNSQPATVAWAIPAGDGAKTVYGRLRDANGNTSQIFTAAVFLDASAPTQPGNLRVVTCAVDGIDRTVTLTWDASSDAPGGTPPTLHGYRLYRSIDAQPLMPLGTTSQSTITDTDRSEHGSVRYAIRAYDRAGNESGDSNVLSFSTGSC